MTNYKIQRAVDKPCLDQNFEGILDRFIDPNGICLTCGKDHRDMPTFENTPTSIDIIPLLLQMLRKWEQSKELDCLPPFIGQA